MHVMKLFMAVNFKLQNFDQFMNDQLKGRGSDCSMLNKQSPVQSILVILVVILNPHKMESKDISATSSNLVILVLVMR